MRPLDFGHKASSWRDPSRGRRWGWRALFGKAQSEPRPPICMRVAAHYDAGARFADCLRIDHAQVHGDSCARLRRTAERRGLTANATKVTEKRFKGVTAKIAASDHCPVAIDLTV